MVRYRYILIALAMMLAMSATTAAQGSKASGLFGSVFLSAAVPESEWSQTMTSEGWGTDFSLHWEYTGEYASHITVTTDGDIITSSPGSDRHRPAGEAVDYPVQFLVSWKTGNRWLRKNGKNPAHKRRGNLVMNAADCKEHGDHRFMACIASIHVFVPAGKTLQVRVRPFWADGTKGPDLKCSANASDWYFVEGREHRSIDIKTLEVTTWTSEGGYMLTAGPFGRKSC